MPIGVFARDSASLFDETRCEVESSAVCVEVCNAEEESFISLLYPKSFITEKSMKSTTAPIKMIAMGTFAILLLLAADFIVHSTVSFEGSIVSIAMW